MTNGKNSKNKWTVQYIKAFAANSENNKSKRYDRHPKSKYIKT